MQFFDGDFQVGDIQGRNLFTLPTPASNYPQVVQKCSTLNVSIRTLSILHSVSDRISSYSQSSHQLIYMKSFESFTHCDFATRTSLETFISCNSSTTELLAELLQWYLSWEGNRWDIPVHRSKQQSQLN